MARRYTYLPILIVLLVIAVLIIGLSRNFLFQNVFEPFFAPLQQTILIWSHAGDNKKIADLEEKNIVLTEQLVDQKKLEQENQVLRNQFNGKQIDTQHLILAEIVSMPQFLPGVSFPTSIIIDKGSADKIRVGQVVVYDTNAIGLIDKVTEHFSEISLLANSSAGIPAVTIKTNALGIIKGQGNMAMILDNVLPSDHLEKDDVVVTKGSQNLDSTGYPPGLIIGKITATEKLPSDLFQKANVELTVDVTRLRMVFVMVK